MNTRQRFLALGLVAVMALFVYRVSDASLGCEFQQDGSELCAISVKELGKNFSYQYEIRRAEKGAPTVVFLPGGPGQGAIGDINTLAKIALIPDQFGVIAIDPRGVGKNNFGRDESGRMYTSPKVASDVLQVIRHENLQNYLVYGESYGTVVATHLAYQISLLSAKDNTIASPKAVVLSRVVGEGFADQIGNYNVQLRRLVEGFSPSERAMVKMQLLKILNEKYRGNSTAFASALMQGTLFNIESEKTGPLTTAPNMAIFFKNLAEGKASVVDPVYRMITSEYAAHAADLSPSSKPQRNFGMAETVKCHELSRIGEEAKIGIDLEKFELVLLQSDCDVKGIALEKPYRSEELQIAGTSLIYMNGDIDPVTPLSGARAHFETQKNKDKTFIETKGFAHVGFLGMWDCRNGLWDSFAQGAAFTANHMSRCSEQAGKVRLSHQLSDLNLNQ